MVGTAALVVGTLLLLGCALLGYLAVRRVRLMRGGGVDVCLRRPSRSSPPRDGSAGWHFGVGRYRGDQLAWHRLTSFRLGPSVLVDRSDLEILQRRAPEGAEAYALPPGAAVLRCRAGAVELEVAMVPGVLTGFLAWLESAPPGRNPGGGYREAS